MVQDLWNEYEFGSTVEGRVVKDLDKFDMIVQAFEYEKATGIDLSEFFAGVDIFTTAEVRNWAQELYNMREELKKEA